MNYKIIIKSGSFDQIPNLLKYGNRYAIISDSRVGKLYGKKLTEKIGKKAILITFPHGERSKNLYTIEQICKKMVKYGFDRHDCVIALGGGVTGDIAGFVASIYMRGINYIQVPTSLIAMVDSSIGGKTGVNTSEGKNLIGTFYQPKAVFIDPNLLKTLPKRHLINGMAEVIKYGCIKSYSLFKFIEQNYQKILNRDSGLLNKIIEQSCAIKSEIVKKDEKEKGLRMILNFGHTIGHALEKLSGFKLLHGEAISIGMIEKCENPALKLLLQKIGLPTKMPKKFSIEQIQKAIKSDKKKKTGHIREIIVKKIGKAHII